MSATHSSITKVALASFIGTTIEWYDFLLYGTAAALVFNRGIAASLAATWGNLMPVAWFMVGLGAITLV